MKSLLILLAVFAASSAEDINLNELCRGILFSTLAHPTDRNSLIGCVQGKGTVLGCRNEDDVFDPIRVMCVDKKSLPTPQEPPVDDICAGIAFGLLPIDDECELHIFCDSERATVRRCPVNSVFNPHTLSCVPGDLETCLAFDKTTLAPTDEPTDPEYTTLWTEDPTTTPSTDTTNPVTDPTILPTTRPPSDVKIIFRCDENGGGNIPNVHNCNRYFECIRGIRNPRECPAGEIFDVITAQCGSPETSLCGRYITCG